MDNEPIVPAESDIKPVETPVAEIPAVEPIMTTEAEVTPVVESAPEVPVSTPEVTEVKKDMTRGPDVAEMPMDEMERLINESMEGLHLRFFNGQQVKGTVSFIDDKSVFVNLHGRQEGVLDRAELLDKEGQLSVEVGSEIEAMVVSTRNDTIQLTLRMEGALAATHLRQAFEAAIPVEGRFTHERKGGYTVDIGGVEAFCPYSQADLRPLPEGTSLAGVPAFFLITQLSDDGDCVVSRRKVLEKEREKQKDALKFTLKVGERITGEVTRVMDFGAFVDLGGVEGMIPGMELSWSGRRVAPSEVLKEGDRATVIVKAIDWDRDRISLSYRGAKTSWEDLASQYPVGSLHRGNVTRIEAFGVFVELGNDVEGLLHISKIANNFRKRIKSPADVYNLGDEVSVRIDGIDDERHRISLDLLSDGTHLTWDEIVNEFQPGTLCEGIVTRIVDFGAFVELENDLEGLLHISRIGNAFRRRINHPQEVLSEGEEIIVEIESVDPERHRISLSLPPKESAAKEKMSVNPGDSFEGIVTSLKPFGVIVDLGGGITGLLHQSQTGDRIVNKVGDCLKVVVREVTDDGRRISLMLEDSADARKEEEEIRAWLEKKDNESDTGTATSFGGLGDAFSGLDLTDLK